MPNSGQWVSFAKIEVDGVGTEGLACGELD
jgi:hypothetical protein